MLIYLSFLASSFDDVIVILNSENRTYPTHNVHKRMCKAWLEKNHFNHHILKGAAAAGAREYRHLKEPGNLSNALQ